MLLGAFGRIRHLSVQQLTRDIVSLESADSSETMMVQSSRNCDLVGLALAVSSQELQVCPPQPEGREKSATSHTSINHERLVCLAGTNGDVVLEDKNLFLL